MSLRSRNGIGADVRPNEQLTNPTPSTSKGNGSLLRKRRNNNVVTAQDNHSNNITPTTSRKGKSLKKKQTEAFPNTAPSREPDNTDFDENEHMILNLSQLRASVHNDFLLTNEFILRELDEKGSQRFAEAMLEKLQQLQQRSIDLTRRLSMLLDPSKAKLDYLLQEDFDNTLEITKAKFMSVFSNVADSSTQQTRMTPTSTPVNLPTKRPRMELDTPPLHSTDTNDHAVDIANYSTTSISTVSLISTPDAWIDMYIRGEKLPDTSERKRPSIPLGQYDGSSLKWFKWIGMVEAIVHNTCMLPAEKLTMLENSLTGRCSGLIQNVGGGEASYKEVLKRLKEYCGDRRAIRAAHITSLHQLYPGKSHSDLITYAEAVRSHLFEISLISLNTDSSHPDLIGEICAKLPSSLVESWYLNELAETGSLNDFSSWLCKKARLQQNPYIKGREDVLPIKHVTSHNVSTNPTGYSSQKFRKCFYCSEQTHGIVRCPSFFKASIEEKTRFLMKSGACFNCLYKGHRAEDCKREKHCRVKGCDIKHHYMLHERYPANKGITNNTTGSDSTQLSS